MHSLIKYPKGSEWRKWDLHIHTKFTNKNDRFTSPDFDSYCTTLFKKAIEKDIAVIGITDYFSLDNYFKVIDFQKHIQANSTFTEQDIKRIQSTLILPNVELRMLPSTGDGKLINIHLIINPKIVQSAEQSIFSKILFKTGQSTSFAMTKDGITNLGRSLLDGTNDSDKAYKKGIKNFTVTHSDLWTLYESDESFRNNVIITVSNKSTDGNSGLQKHYEHFEDENGSLDTIRSSIYKLSHCIFSSRPKDREYFLGLGGTDNIAQVIKKTGSLKPCIHGSDAHTESELFNPDQNRFCWIKADPSFDGFMQLLHEPEGRVIVNEIRPDEKTPYQVIDYIKIDSNHVVNERIDFNQNLNTIIGGRSSGKSMLMAAIAKKLGKLDTNIISKNKEYTKAISEFFPTISIHWCDGKEDDNRQIEYFHQGYIHDQVRAGGINSLIREKITRSGVSNAESLLQILTAEHKQKITPILDELWRLKIEIETADGEVRELGNIEDIKAEISRLEAELKNTHKGEITDQDLIEYNIVKDKITSCQQEREKCTEDMTLIQRLKATEVIRNDIISNPTLATWRHNAKIEAVLEEIKLKTQEIWQRNLLFLEQASTESYERAFKEEGCLIAAPAIAKVEINSQLLSKFSNLQNLLTAQYEKLKLAESKIFALINKKDLYSKLIATTIPHELNKFRDQINEIVTKLNQEISDFGFLDSGDISIYCFIEEDINRYRDFLENSFDRRSNQNSTLINSIEDSDFNLIHSICDVYQSILNKKVVLKSGVNTESFFSNLILDKWLEIKYNLSYEDDNFKDMSEGKKAFVFLKLVLENSDKKCPILIDQPEDDLDNRSTYKDLVKYLKNKKIDRQIIVATHNANIVVNADSELVIVANQQGVNSSNVDEKKFQYLTGSIEYNMPHDSSIDHILHSMGIREHICEILEGGAEAFKQRERKYDL